MLFFRPGSEVIAMLHVSAESFIAEYPFRVLRTLGLLGSVLTLTYSQLIFQAFLHLPYQTFVILMTHAALPLFGHKK